MSKEISIGREQIQSSYFNEAQAKTFLVLSDMHYHPHVDKTLYKMIIQYVINKEPDYIVMPGDVFDTEKFLDNKESLQFFDTFIRCLSEVSKVVIIPGNHDAANFDTKAFFNKKYVDENRSMKYLASLNNIPNVYFLNNEQLDISNLTFLGLNPRSETYLKKDDPKTNEKFIEDYFKGNYHISEGNYNILLCHNPIPLFDKGINDSISDFTSCDLAIAGHLHNGYVPKWLDERLKNTNIGIFTVPLVAPYPGTPCRGLHPFGRGQALISRGFRKYGTDLFPFNDLDKIATHDMEELTVSNPKVKVK